MIAAGPWAYSWYLQAMKGIQDVGAVTTKSYTFFAREGNSGVVGHALPHGAYLNRVGLKNGGFEQAIEEAQKCKEIGVPVFLSVADEYTPHACSLIRATVGYVDGFEINVSCPNSYTSRSDVQSIEFHRYLSAIRDLTGKPITVKLPSDASVAQYIVQVAESLKLDGLVSSNTMPARMLMPTGEVVTGGLSSPTLMYVNGANILSYKEFTDLPVIACGGVAKKDDVDYYLGAAKADFVQVGSSLLETRSSLLDILE